MKFRTDINAIRALAVLSVVIFHFSPDWLPGGFVGVDIFFVISGYLMTRIVMSGLEKNSFSLAGFYSARLARIAPALITLCVVMLAFGWVYLAPQAFDILAKHVRYSVSFMSNLTYHEEAGYFDAVSRDKWLLHTWSLSVEWQFYLVYPLLLAGLERLGAGRHTFKLINVLMLASLVHCLYMNYFQPTLSPYYLLQTRAWEMLLGSWAFFFKPNKDIFKSYIGWVILLISVIFVDEGMAWPGIWTLLPTVGTLWILLANQSHRLTTIYPVQQLGLSSYSIYLWHWPVVVLFYKLGFTETGWTLVGILLSIVLGLISYYTIEQLRFRRDIANFRLLIMKSAPLWGLALTLGAAKLINEQDGVETRSTLSDDVVAMYEQLERKHQKSPMRKTCHRNDSNSAMETCPIFSDNPGWATLGDSHSAELSYSLASELRQQKDGVAQYSFANCPPSYGRSKTFSPCAEWTNKAVEEINNNPDIKQVVIAYRYSLHLFGDTEATYPELPSRHTEQRRQLILESLDGTINSFLDAGKQVFIMMPVPEMGRSVKSQIDSRFMRNEPLDTVPSVSLDYVAQRNEMIDGLLSGYNDKAGVHLIPVQDLFCDQDTCYSIKNGQALYYDHNHPGLPVTRQIAQRILAQSEE